MIGRELKHPYSGIALPCEVWADPGRHDWYFREKKPDSVARFVSEDCTPDPVQIRADALREALAALGDAGYGSSVAARVILDLIDAPPSPTAVDNSPAPDAGGKP